MRTVFISYSWESEAHKSWVGRLGEDLRAHGITVWLDQFEMKLGDDVTEFMERGVSDAGHVLMVCTESFGNKANERLGGVGYEQSVVTSEILNSRPPRGRFVCLLRQGTPSLALPRYMQSRLWLDCRDDSAYPNALTQLVEHFLSRPDRLTSKVTGIAPLDSPHAKPSIAFGKPRQWVLVAGTGARRGFSPDLEALSSKLGSSLASVRCGLITGGWPGVDEWVARSFANTINKLGAALEDALVQIVPNTKEPAFPAGQLVFVKKGEQEWNEPIRRASVVLLIGGLGGTKESGKRALSMRRPVLPIADTGGDAKVIYLDMLKHWSDYSWMGVSEKEFQRLGRPASFAIEAAVDLLTGVRGAA